MPVRRAHDRHPLGEETACDEADDLHGSLIEPLRIVDDADKRLLLGDVGEQRQRGQSHQESLGRRACTKSEHGLERFPLRGWQPVETIQHAPTELMEAAVRQLHLRFDPDRGDEMPAGDAVDQVGQQRTLAYPGFPPEHDRPTRTGERVGD